MLKRHTSTTLNVAERVVRGTIFTLLETSTKKHATFSTKWEERDLKDLIPIRAKTKGNSFQKIGTLNENGKFRPFTFIKGTFEHSIFKLFWEGLKISHVQTNIEFWNPCKCEKCGRLLTDPVSIALGIGPGCTEIWKINDSLHNETPK